MIINARREAVIAPNFVQVEQLLYNLKVLRIKL